MSTLWILYVEFYRNTHWEQKERHVVVLTVPTPNIRKFSSLASYCAKCSKPTNKNPWFYQQICSYIIHLSYSKLSTKSNKPFIRLEWWKWFIWRKVSKLQIKTSKYWLREMQQCFSVFDRGRPLGPVRCP